MAKKTSSKKVYHSNELLRVQRLRRNWSQKKVADEITAPDDRTVARWEQGVMPGAFYRERLCALYGGISEHALGFVPGQSPYWNSPERLPFFTGRDQLLARIEEALISNQSTDLLRPVLLQGLGGVGKTTIAIEYAYRHREWYQLVLWVNAETPERLASDYLSLAELLADLLPPMQAREGRGVQEAIEAVKNVLVSLKRWLLVFDNVEDLHLVRKFLPQHIRGDVLITTRQQASGPFVQHFLVDTMNPSEGALFLLRRAKYLAPVALLEEASQAVRTEALALSQELGGLPLALDQAAAYIEEVPETLEHYRRLYRERQQILLARRGRGSGDHPESVLATLSLSFDHVQRENQASADLLRLCAFVASEEIPEELFIEGASTFDQPLRATASDPIARGEALEIARRRSLLVFDPQARTLRVHRVVQAVLKSALDEISQCHWAKLAVQAVNRAMPNVEDREAWERSRRVFPHALVCAAWIAQWNMAFPEAARLLAQTGNALWIRGQYGQAESFQRRALAMREMLLDASHPDIIESLANLATTYSDQGRYDLSDPLYQRALNLTQQAGQGDSLFTARVLNAFAEEYRERELYTQAEPLYLQAQDIIERLQGPNSLLVAMVLSNRVGAAVPLGRFAEAEPMLVRAYTICEQHLGPTHPVTAAMTSNLGALYCAWGVYDQAERFLQQGLADRRKVWGGDTHPDVAQSLNNLGELYDRQGSYKQAETLYQEALEIYQRVGLQDHLFTEMVLRNYAQLLKKTHRLQEAHDLIIRAEAISSSRILHIRGEVGSSKDGEFEAFFAACCRSDPHGRESLTGLWNVYLAWANRRGVEPAAHHERALAAFLKTKGCSPVRTKQNRMWVGVVLRDEYRVNTMPEEVTHESLR